MDNNNSDEFESMWDDEVAVPSIRTPSLKELASQIKDLQRENFQLKLRIHLTETKGVADPITSTTTPKKIFTDTEKEHQVLKVENEQLEIKLRQKQSQLLHEIQLKDEIVQREASLLKKYTELKTKFDLLEREKCLHRLRQGSPMNDQSSFLTPKSLTRIPINGDVASFLDHSQNLGAQEWSRKYDQQHANYLALEPELCQVRNELQGANNDRLLLLKQLKISETTRKKETLIMDNSLQESMDQLMSKNKSLKVSNDELKLALEKADERAQEMSSQLYYHQTALEKVHKEQGLLIAELQTLKKSCPFKIQNALKICNEMDEEIEMDVVSTEMKESSHFLSMPKNLDDHSSKESSRCKMNIIDYQCHSPNSFGSTSKVSSQHDDNIAHVNKKLYEKNSKLAIKLKQTREGMKNVISMLEYVEKDKAATEKIICRQLYKAHCLITSVKNSKMNVNCQHPDSTETEREKN